MDINLKDISLKHFIILGIVLFILYLVYSMTANVFVKKYGGSMTINLNKDERLVNMTWKDNDLWILTTTDSNQSPKVYKFKEDSRFGILEGVITINEK